MDKKNLITTLKLLSIIVVLLVFLLTVIVIDNRGNKYLDNNTKTTMVKVLSTYDDFILVQDVENEDKYTIYTDDEYSLGDYLYITYLDDIEDPRDIELIISGEETKKNKVVEEENIIENTKRVTITALVDGKPKIIYDSNYETTTTTTEVVTTTTPVKVNENIDDIVVGYVTSAKTTIDNYILTEDNKTKAKNTFITIVDFIFYDGSIKGHTFNELSTSAKAKVIYYALLIDNKIETNWPGYKDSISTKYQDIKAKLIAKYMDLCEYVRVNEPDLYEGLKYDFNLLKSSLNLTWDIVKAAFKYASNVTISYLKNWYETFRG